MLKVMYRVLVHESGQQTVKSTDKIKLDKLPDICVVKYMFTGDFF